MIMKPEIAVASSGQKAKLSADLDVKSYVKEPKRRVPVIDTADVVILLEKQYYLGGLWTGCCVLPIIDKYFFIYLSLFICIFTATMSRDHGNSAQIPRRDTDLIRKPEGRLPLYG